MLMRKILDLLGVRYPASRILLWYCMLRSLRGVTLKDNLALYLSAIIDIARSVAYPRTIRNPINRFSCVVYVPELDARFCIRRNSDDLYSVCPHREGIAHDAILKPLSEGDIFIDVGANVGYYSIVASKRVGLLGHVIAIEAFPDTVEQLRTNITLNCAHNIEVIQAAAYSETGKKVVLEFTKGFWGQVRVAEEIKNDGQQIFCSTIRIDDVCKAYSHIKVLKLDIEGAEYEALRGAEETLLKVEYVIAECTQKKREIISLLKEKGFQVSELSYTTYIIAKRQP